MDKFDDKYFAKEVEKKKKKGENEFFEGEKEVSQLLYTVYAANCVFFSNLVMLVFSQICRRRNHFPRRKRKIRSLLIQH